MGQGDDQRVEIGDRGAHGGGRSSNNRPIMVTLVNGVRGAAPKEKRSDVGSHGLWRQGTTALFDVSIINLDAGSHLHMTPQKDLAKAEKDN